MRTIGVFLIVLTLAGGWALYRQWAAPTEFLLERAAALELDTPYEAPPGDPLLHHAAGFAKIMCSAVFITGLDPDFAAENVGYFRQPLRRARQAR